MKKIVLFVVAVCMMCLCFAGCNNTGKSQVKYVLYCGLNDADTGSQMLTVTDAQAAARKVITDRGLGYTEYVTYGAYTENDAVKGNDTLVYVLFYVEKVDAQSVAKEIKETLHLAAVLVVEVADSYGFAE